MLCGHWQKPMQGTQVNRCHPFAQGTVSAYPFNDYQKDNVKGTWFNDGCKQNDARVLVADTDTIRIQNENKFGPAVEFDQTRIPVEGVHTIAAGNGSQDFISQVSFSAWIYLWSGYTSYRPVFCRQQVDNTTRWLYVGVTGANQRFEIRYISGGVQRALSGPDLAGQPWGGVDKWIHVGFVFNYLAVSMRWFVDGRCVLENAPVVDLEVFGGIGWQIGHAAGENFSWRGSGVDFVHIFNQAISDQAMQALAGTPACVFERKNPLLPGRSPFRRTA